MKKITVREIMAIPFQEIWNLNSATYKVIYDDKTSEECSYKAITFNRYIWILYEMYPDTPILTDTSLQPIINKQYFTADVHIRLLEKTFKNICTYNKLDTFDKKENLLRLVYKVYNLLYVDYINRISSYVTTIDSVDFIEVLNLEEIKKIHDEIKPHPEYVENAYKEIRRILNNSDKADNMFIHAYKSKSINENQANQCIGPRGFVTDIDRTVFKQPILGGFITGMRNLFELTTESRTAAKSLNASDKHIAQSEYNSRLMQILTMIVDQITYGDCGSTEYLDFLVMPKSIHHLKGKYYLDTSSNTLKCIDGTETQLEETIIKLRTTMGCKLEDQHSICSTCLGDISKNFKQNSNLGYTFTSFLMEKASQSILSTKHLTHSVRNNEIMLEGNALRYFRVKGDELYLHKELDTSCLSIMLESKQLYKLMDVLNLSHNHIALEKIGEITDVTFIEDKGGKKIALSVNVQYGDRNCILTKEFLEYIRLNTILSDTKGNYIVPLHKFHRDYKIFTMPLKENNMINFVTKLTSIVETNFEKITDPYDKLDILYEHVSKQFSLNLSVLEVLIYATTIYNLDQLDYSLGRNSPYIATDNMTNLHKFRSLAMLFATNDQESAIFKSNLVTMLGNNRMNHPMDVYFDPHGLMVQKR